MRVRVAFAKTLQMSVDLADLVRLDDACLTVSAFSISIAAVQALER